MRTRLLRLTLVSTLSMIALASCDNSGNERVDSSADTEKSVSTETDNATTATETSSVVTDIDWSKVASGEQAAERANYDYPFDIDSKNVQDYADYFKVDKATAQHNLTVGMASNEALSKVLDQLSNSYTSHELTDGETVELIVHATPEVQASQYEYVFADDFAKGLVLPIKIVPDGKKSEATVNPHEELGE
ncbi:hypothetical protein ACS8FD_05780 [Psychrobacter sp. 1U2]|uniref:hypothetical protein n=1 Tax=Psychrobacter sp. 1U2 TaxID=3453577 RepID=UPI003F472E33